LNRFRVFFHISFLRFSCWLLSRGGKATAAEPSPASAARTSTATGSWRPWPSLPSPLPAAQPIFWSMPYPLFSCLMAVSRLAVSVFACKGSIP
jgi:hypothetical protein